MQPTTNPLSSLSTNPPRTPTIGLTTSNKLSTTSNLPESYKQALLRDRSALAFTDKQYNPRSRLAGHPLATFITAPQIPTTLYNLGTALDPFQGRGLQASLVLTPPRSTTDMGRAANLSAREIDSYLLRGQYSTTSLTFPISGYMKFSSPNRRMCRTRYFLPALSLVVGSTRASPRSMTSQLARKM
jgi:hypothetical protein